MDVQRSGQKNEELEKQPKQVVKHEVFSQVHSYFSARPTQFGPHDPSVSVPSVEKS